MSSESMCIGPGCDRPALYKSACLCQKHYFRARRGRPLEDRPRGVPFIVDPRGYLGIYEPSHPLAHANGVVPAHRKALFDSGSVVNECDICKVRVTWKSCHVDHIDENPSNNAIGNLRPLCMDCNVKRTKVIDRRGATVLIAEGERKTLSEWSRDIRVQVGIHTIIRRKKLGMSDEHALFLPRQRGPKRRLEADQTLRKYTADELRSIRDDYRARALTLKGEGN